MDNDALKDKRFAHISTDLRFKGVPRHERKIKIDNRFSEMFTNKSFKLKYSVDKRGRPQNYTTNEDLKKFYDLASSDDEEDDGAQTRSVARRKTRTADSSSSSSSDEEEENDERSTLDLARGDGNIESSSSDDDSTDEEEEEEPEMIHPWGELDENAERTEESTSRLAICNMDWDRMNAKDIYVLLNSFVSVGGVIKSVKIYLSDFGRERLGKEDLNGPEELTSNKRVEDAENDEKEESADVLKKSDADAEGEQFQMEKVREYEMNRLRYYYAIVECDRVYTADRIYDNCDGLEYESSATKLDVRFVPDGMEFSDEPRDVVNSSMDIAQYRPKLFVNKALQQATVKLTWDETNPNRTEVLQQAFDGDDEENMDLKGYLASSGDETSDDEGKAVPKDDAAVESNEESENDAEEMDRISKYKLLLKNLEENESKKNDDDVKMEITWGTGLKEKTELLTKKKQSELNQTEESELSPWVKYLLKRKEKKREKRERAIERSKLTDDAEEGRADKTYSDDELPSDVDRTDSFFVDNGDKSKMELPKSKKKSKNKRSKKSDVTVDSNETDGKEQSELELLLMDEDDGRKHHFSLKKLLETSKKAKSKRKVDEAEEGSKTDDFKMNVSDPRFSAIYSSHLYNIDPSELQYKKTEGMEAIIKEKQQRLASGSRNIDSVGSSSQTKRLKYDFDGGSLTKVNTPMNSKAELSLLVKSIKSKAANFKMNRHSKKSSKNS